LPFFPPFFVLSSIFPKGTSHPAGLLFFFLIFYGSTKLSFRKSAPGLPQLSFRCFPPLCGFTFFPLILTFVPEDAFFEGRAGSPLRLYAFLDFVFSSPILFFSNLRTGSDFFLPGASAFFVAVRPSPVFVLLILPPHYFPSAFFLWTQPASVRLFSLLFFSRCSPSFWPPGSPFFRCTLGIANAQAPGRPLRPFFTSFSASTRSLGAGEKVPVTLLRKSVFFPFQSLSLMAFPPLYYLLPRAFFRLVTGPPESFWTFYQAHSFCFFSRPPPPHSPCRS